MFSAKCEDDQLKQETLYFPSVFFFFCFTSTLLYVPLDFQTCIASSNSSTDRLCGIILSAKFTRAEEWVHTCKIDSETKSRMIRSSPAKTTTALIKSKLSISQENDDDEMTWAKRCILGLAWLGLAVAVAQLDIWTFFERFDSRRESETWLLLCVPWSISGGEAAAIQEVKTKESVWRWQITLQYSPSLYPLTFQKKWALRQKRGQNTNCKKINMKIRQKTNLKVMVMVAKK